MAAEKIYVGSDHAGFSKKKTVIAWLEKNGYEAHDVGCFSEDSVDYPDYARPVAEAVAQKKASWGVLLCGSGVGVSIVANKTKGVRAVLAFQPEIAKLARNHNNANVICFPARFMSDDDVVKSLNEWANAEFENGRHTKRVDKIENAYFQ